MRLPLLPVLLCSLAIVGGGCAADPSAAKPPAQHNAPSTAPIQVGPTVRAEHGVVVSVCPIASKAGCEILRRGGNAVDAAVATAFTLAVTWPEAGNIGGGGFMMIHDPGPSGEARTAGAAPLDNFIDYRETAPAAVKADTFASKPSSYLLAGTPGTVKGLRLAYDRYGSREIAWKDLVLPAAELAEKGFEVDPALARSLNSGLRNAEQFAEFRRVYGKPDGSAWKGGDRLVLPDLAKTLRTIAEHGDDWFYKGSVAQLIADEMKRGGGLMTAEDLAKYEPVVRRPLVGTFKGYTILAPPPPSSGGIAMLQILNMLELLQVKGRENRWSPRTVHLLIEATRRAYADRARYLGDPDFTQVPAEKLISDGYARSLMANIDPNKASRSEDVAKWAQLSESGEQTTHFSIVDSNGMAVANTFTLEQSFGGKIVVPGAGFLLNNELGDFNPRPGVTTRLGLIGTEPNQATGGKRPLSSMTPTIVLRDGKVALVTGSPGGRTIINTVTQVVLNRLAFDMDLREAVDAPRLHHQWFPDVLHVEASFQKDHAELLEQLKAMGHQIDPKPTPHQGDAHSIGAIPKHDGWVGVADQRIRGAAAGY